MVKWTRRLFDVSTRSPVLRGSTVSPGVSNPTDEAISALSRSSVGVMRQVGIVPCAWLSPVSVQQIQWLRTLGRWRHIGRDRESNSATELVVGVAAVIGYRVKSTVMHAEPTENVIRTVSRDLKLSHKDDLSVLPIVGTFVQPCIETLLEIWSRFFCLRFFSSPVLVELLRTAIFSFTVKRLCYLFVNVALWSHLINLQIYFNWPCSSQKYSDHEDWLRKCILLNLI